MRPILSSLPIASTVTSVLVTTSSGNDRSMNDTQPAQHFTEVDRPSDAHALGREQAMVVGVPNAFVPVLQIPVDRHAGKWQRRRIRHAIHGDQK